MDGAGSGVAVTYNFDPDNWYENQRRLLEHRLASSQIGQDDYRQKLEELNQRYEEMVQRLDGTYTLPRGLNHEK
jgi:hypothetical protein